MIEDDTDITVNTLFTPLVLDFGFSDFFPMIFQTSA